MSSGISLNQSTFQTCQHRILHKFVKVMDQCVCHGDMLAHTILFASLLPALDAFSVLLECAWNWNNALSLTSNTASQRTQVSLKNTPFTQTILCTVFNIHGHHTMFKVQWTRT